MFRLFGPPGTGKTTTLLNMVDKALSEGLDPTQIGFLAFTRKAANEAKERASLRFNLDPEKDLCHFRTIHSLAYRTLAIKSDQVIQKEHFDELSEKVGMELRVHRMEDDEVGGSVTSDHPILSLINLARLKKTSLQREYDLSSIDFQWHEVDYLDRTYRAYKQVNGLIDFTDLLQMFLDSEQACPHFELCFMDEAQDLSPLQWDIAHKIDSRSSRMYCAGDDDQAIYRWAGADVNHFIHLSGDSETLEQSYRIPRAVHQVAESIVTRISDRFPKTYLPREEEGMVTRMPSIDDIEIGDGSWLIMAQANYMLTPLTQDLKSRGLLFERNGHRSISEKLTIAVNAWEALRKGRHILTDHAQTIYGFMTGNNEKIERGKKTIKTDAETVNLKQLQSEHGLLAGADEIWSQALNKIPDVDRAYITALLRSGEKFNAKPRIKLSTIHGAKGGEADNVILLQDLSYSALQNNLSDDLHRVFYVAVTRTKQNLFLIDPEDTFRSYSI